MDILEFGVFRCTWEWDNVTDVFNTCDVHNHTFIKNKKTKIIGVILSDFIGPYFSSLLAGIQQVRENGYDVIIISGIETGERFIRQKLVEGMIMINPAIDDEIIQAYANNDMPFILLDRKFEGEGIYNIMINNRDAFYEIVEGHIHNVIRSKWK